MGSSQMNVWTLWDDHGNLICIKSSREKCVSDAKILKSLSSYFEIQSWDLKQGPRVKSKLLKEELK